MENKIQGSYKTELKFVDKNRVYFNFWDGVKGNDVLCQIKDGKLFKFVHTPQEVEKDQLRDKTKIKDVFEQVEITLSEFVELVQQTVINSKL